MSTKQWAVSLYSDDPNKAARYQMADDCLELVSRVFFEDEQEARGFVAVMSCSAMEQHPELDGIIAEISHIVHAQPIQ